MEYAIAVLAYGAVMGFIVRLFQVVRRRDDDMHEATARWIDERATISVTARQA